MPRPLALMFLIVIFPLVVSSQVSKPRPNQEATSAPPSLQAGTFLDDTRGEPATTSNGDAQSSNAQTQQSNTPPQQKPKSGKPKSPSTSLDRPPIEGSMVGYIDDAIIGSEVRFRFDAGFDDNRPDRAEFFYAACGCLGGGAAGPKPGLVAHLNFEQLYMYGEYAPVRRFSAFVEIPFRWIQPQKFAPNTLPGFGNQGGLSDVSAGFKVAVLSTAKHYLTFQFGATFPSGDSYKGLGTDHYSVEPNVLYFQKISDRLTFEGQLGDTHPIGGDVPGFPGDVFTYGVGPSYTVYTTEQLRITPVIEVVGWRVIGGKVADADLKAQDLPPVISADGTNIVNLKAGFRTSIGNHNSIYLGYGQALTHEIWYKHLVRLEYRYTF